MASTFPAIAQSPTSPRFTSVNVNAIVKPTTLASPRTRTSSGGEHSHQQQYQYQSTQSPRFPGSVLRPKTANSSTSVASTSTAGWMNGRTGGHGEPPPIPSKLLNRTDESDHLSVRVVDEQSTHLHPSSSSSTTATVRSPSPTGGLHPFRRATSPHPTTTTSPAATKSILLPSPPMSTPTGLASLRLSPAPLSTPKKSKQPKQRLSLLHTASDALWSSFSGVGRRGSVFRKPTAASQSSSGGSRMGMGNGGIMEEEDGPVLDIRAEPKPNDGVGAGGNDLTDEEMEREALREEAAKSVGLSGSSANVERERAPTIASVDERHGGGEEEGGDEDEDDVAPLSVTMDESFVSTSNGVGPGASAGGVGERRRPSLPVSGSLAPSVAEHSQHQQHPHYAVAPSLVSMRSAESSVVSLPRNPSIRTTTTGRSGSSPGIPSYPASLASLLPYAQTSSTLLRHYSGGSFFLSKSRQWKSRHLVLTSIKPTLSPTSPPNTPEPDTLAHLHLFRSSASEEREVERMRIDEDSVVFVVDSSPTSADIAAVDVLGRKFVLKIGGRYAGGGDGTSSTAGARRRPTTLGMGGMGGIGAMGTTAMAVSLGGRQDQRVLWLVQCGDSGEMQRWIKSVKQALLVQRAERAGLAMSLPEAQMTGDLDVLLQMRAQGILQPASPTALYIPPPSASSASAIVPPGSPTMASKAPSIIGDDSASLHVNTRSGRSRSSTTTTTTSPSAVHALKGLFTGSGGGSNNGLGGGLNSSNRPRSQSSVTTMTTISPVSAFSTAGHSFATTLVDGSSNVSDDPKDQSFGNRASALLNLSLQRAARESSLPPPASTSSLLSQSITPHDEIRDFDIAAAGEASSTSLNKPRSSLHAGVTYSGHERPASSSSLPPPPRTKRLGSAGGSGLGPPPRSPVLDQSLQEELKKAMFAPVMQAFDDADGVSGRRNSTDTIPEEAISPGVPGVRTSIDRQGRVSFESVTDTPITGGPVTPVEKLVPFPMPMKSSASFGADLVAPRPASAMSHASTGSFRNASSPTSPMDANTSSPTSTLARSPSSPKRSRKVPKMLAPPAGPLPAAPTSPPWPDQKALHPNSNSSEGGSGSGGGGGGGGRDRGSTGGSLFNAKRISTSSTGISIRSFTSGSSSSRSNSAMRSSLVHPSPRPPPTFAPPPAPLEASQAQAGSGPGDLPLNHPFAAEPTYSSSLRSLQRNSTLSNSSSATSPSRSDFNVRLHRLTPPSAPPPTGALPPRPDAADTPSPLSVPRPSSGHHRSGSLSTSTNGNTLSTIPASPPNRITDLPVVNGATVATKRLNVASLPPQSAVPQAISAPISRQSSLRARLRMLSTPSPRPPPQPLPPLPTTAIPSEKSTPDPNTTTTTTTPADPLLSTPRSRCNTLEPPPSSAPEPLDRPIALLSSALDSQSITTTVGASTPPIPPRSLARPQSARVTTDGSPEQPQRTLSPPPRRGSRQSREISVPPIPRMLLEPDILDPSTVSERNGEWEPSIRDSAVLLM